jgi:hypothetical protein
MAKKERETVSVENLVLSQTYTMQALINVLERKGDIDKRRGFGRVEEFGEHGLR